MRKGTAAGHASVSRAGAALLAAALLAAGAAPGAAHPERHAVRRIVSARDGAGTGAGDAADAERAARREALEAARARLAERWAPLFRHDVARRPAARARARDAGRGWRELLKAAEAAPDRRDTLRIAAFRFEFEHDGGGDATTGEGRFDLSAGDGSVFIDPPPHDRAYFEAHFRALERYWRATSSGRIEIEWTIFPPGDSAAYKLDDSADYLPEGDPASWTFESRGCGISRLVRDWIAHVDSADTAFRFSDYNSYLFIHAGPDLQGDVNGDSPGDIPSFNITFAFPDTACGIDSIYVHDGSDSMLVDNAWVVPETISQDFFVGALNGTLTHESGHQFGLPDLYDTYYFFPSVGVWDLMDSGDSQPIGIGDTDVHGLIPGGLSAWSRFFLGLETPLVVSDFLALDSLVASTLPDYAQLPPPLVEGAKAGAPARSREPAPPAGAARIKQLLIPISPREYYLIENRQSELDGDPTPVVDADSATGVVLGPARLEVVGPDTIEVANDEYDFPLPGYGALIWHVDERALNEETISVNAVNVNPYRRGLRLEEADGIPDLGNFYSIYFRGSPYDPFFEGNNDRFDRTSSPNSRSNDDTETGIAVTEISEPGILMSMRVDLAPRLPGFPIVLGDSLKSRRSLLVGPTVGANADGEATLAVVVGSDYLADGLRAAGRVFGVPLPIGSAPAWSRALPESVTIPCAVGDADGDPATPGDAVVVLGDSGTVYAFDAAGAPHAAADSLGRIAELPGAFLFPPLVVTESAAAGAPAAGAGPLAVVAVGDSGAFRVAVDAGGASVRGGRADSPPASNPIVIPESRSTIYYLTAGGRLAAYVPVPSNATGVTSRYPELAADISFLLWGDLDRDSAGNEWVGVSRAGQVTAAYFAEQTSRLPGYPVDLGAEVLTFPSLGDLDGDGRLEVLIPTEDGRVFCLEWNGARRTGWPIRLPERLDGAVIAGETPLVADIDASPGAEVVIGIRDGRIMAYGADGRALPGWPYGAGEPFQYTPAAVSLAPAAEQPPALALLVAPYDGFLYGLRIGEQAPPGSVQWGGIGRDGAHVAGIGREELNPPSARGGALLVASKSFAYPNPVSGAETVIRCRLGRDGRVGMKIYDLSGELVHEVAPIARPAGDNEFRWDLTNVASGVYLCDLSVEEGGESASTLVKIAVLR
jgi:M6 family metalloprotease-like protein